MSTDSYLRCKFCEWKKLKWRGYRKPNKKAIEDLKYHISQEHPDKYDEINKLLQEDK